MAARFKHLSSVTSRQGGGVESLSRHEFKLLLQLEGFQVSQKESDRLFDTFSKHRGAEDRISLGDFLTYCLPPLSRTHRPTASQSSRSASTASASSSKHSRASPSPQVAVPFIERQDRPDQRRSRPATASGMAGRARSPTPPSSRNHSRAQSRTQSRASRRAASPPPPAAAAPHAPAAGAAAVPYSPRPLSSSHRRNELYNAETRDLERSLLRKVHQLGSVEHLDRMFHLFAEDTSAAASKSRLYRRGLGTPRSGMTPQQFHEFLLYLGLEVVSEEQSRVLFDKFNRNGDRLMFNEFRVFVAPQQATEDFNSWRRRLSHADASLTARTAPPASIFHKNSKEVMQMVRTMIRQRSSLSHAHSQAQFELGKAFHFYDVYADSRVTRQELAEVLTQLGCGLDDDYVDVLFKRFMDPSDHDLFDYVRFMEDVIGDDSAETHANELEDDKPVDPEQVAEARRAKALANLPSFPSIGDDGAGGGLERLLDADEGVDGDFDGNAQQQLPRSRPRTASRPSTARSTTSTSSRPSTARSAVYTPLYRPRGSPRRSRAEELALTIDENTADASIGLLPLTEAMSSLIPSNVLTERAKPVFDDHPQVHNQTHWSYNNYGRELSSTHRPPVVASSSSSCVPKHERLNWSYNSRVGEPRPMSAYGMEPRHFRNSSSHLPADAEAQYEAAREQAARDKLRQTIFGSHITEASAAVSPLSSRSNRSSNFGTDSLRRHGREKKSRRTKKKRGGRRRGQERNPMPVAVEAAAVLPKVVRVEDGEQAWVRADANKASVV